MKLGPINIITNKNCVYVYGVSKFAMCFHKVSYCIFTKVQCGSYYCLHFIDEETGSGVK